MREIRFIDLFAGIGGMRLALEQAAAERGIPARCALTSEIKPAARAVLSMNHPGEDIAGDIREIPAEDIPDFDILLAGFPCQPFSYAGRRRGFADTRGTLFFEIARILEARRPAGFVLENVEGLVVHDREHRGDPMGRTFRTILETLGGLGYAVSWRVIDSADCGLPQRRRRLYIAGAKTAPDLAGIGKRPPAALSDILESGVPAQVPDFARLLLEHFTPGELAGKSIKDKRGGPSNIHSWDIGWRGGVSVAQKELMEAILLERRRKKWAEEAGIDWMDGMPLTEAQIAAFFPHPDLHAMLGDLREKGYLALEHPKRREGGRRVPDPSIPAGFNIRAGKMSFPVSAILDPAGAAPTLTATDMDRLHVPDGKIIRRLTLREGLRLFGYPEDFILDVPEKEGYDLLGNTVAVPAAGAVCGALLEAAGF